jgi:hypothetical protein
MDTDQSQAKPQGTMVELFTIVARRPRDWGSLEGVSLTDPADSVLNDAEGAERALICGATSSTFRNYEHAPEHDGIRRALQRTPGSRNVN